MGTTIRLQADDGHSLSAYLAQPAAKPRGALIVAMEIFGVNSHIQSVADGYAAAGYLAIAPALFDRAQRDYIAGYTQEDIQRGIAIIQQLNLDDTMRDVAAARNEVARAGKIGIVGYCWGGTVAWKSACSLDGLACAIAYYGGGVPGLIALQPRCPVLFHWGETDGSIPMDKAKAFAAAHPGQTHHFYAVNCDQRGSYDKSAADLARSRTLDFLAKYVG